MPNQIRMYKLLKVGVDQVFLEYLLDELTEKEYYLVFYPIFKRILNDTSNHDIFKTEELIKALELLKYLIVFDDRILRCFYRSPLLIPKEAKSLEGYSLQTNSILGSALSISTLPNTYSNQQLYKTIHKNPSKTEKFVEDTCQRINQVINIVQDIVGYIAQREGQGYEAIISWIYMILESNNNKNKVFNTQDKFCTEGFLINFLALLLKLSRPYLNEITEPTGLSKIDPMYLREKKIFDNLPLINGNSNFYFPSVIEEAKEHLNKKHTIVSKTPPENDYQEEFGRFNGDQVLDSDESYKQENVSSESVNSEDYGYDYQEEEEKNNMRQKHSLNSNKFNRPRLNYEEDIYHNQVNYQEDSSFNRSQKVQSNHSSAWRDESISEEVKQPLDLNEFKITINPDRFNMDDNAEQLSLNSQNKEASNSNILVKKSSTKDEELILTTTTFPSKNTHEAIENDPVPQFNFLTEMIFLTNHILRLAYPQFEKYSKLVQEANNNDEDIEHFLNQSHFKKNLLKTVHEVHYSDPELWDNLTKFLVIDAIYIAYNRGIPLKSFTDSSEIFEAYLDEPVEKFETMGMIPTYWTESIVHYLPILIHACPYLAIKAPGPYRTLTNFMLVAMGEKSWINNPHLKAEYLNFFNSLVPENSDQDSEFNLIDSKVSAIILNENAFFEEQLTSNLMSFFWHIQKANSTNEFEKYNYRHSFCKFFNHLAGSNSVIYLSQKVRLNLVKFTKDQTGFQKFSCVLLNDMMALLDDSLSRMKDIRKYYDFTHSPGFNALLPQERTEQEFLCQQNRHSVYAASKYLIEYFEFLLTLVILNNKSFVSDEQLQEKLVTNLNYTAAQLLSSPKQAISISEMQELDFDAIEILYFIVLILCKFNSEESFIKRTVADERSYSLKCYQDGLIILVEENLLSDHEIYEFKFLTNKWKQFSEQKMQEDEFLKNLGDSVPDEFIDPIMGHIMKQSVLLLTSNVIVDYSTIMRHLMTEATDPFNRKELWKDMLVQQPELLKRVNEFLNDKRRIWEEEKAKK